MESVSVVAAPMPAMHASCPSYLRPGGAAAISEADWSATDLCACRAGLFCGAGA